MTDAPISLREVPTAAHDIPGSLRRLADQIDAGGFANVQAVGVVVLNNGHTTTYGYGRDGDRGTIALMFQNAIQKFARGLD